MNIMDILSQAQGGNAIGNIAKQVGISPDQAGSVLKELMPQFGNAIKEKTKTKDGLEGMFDMFSQKGSTDVVDDESKMADPSFQEQGKSILGDLFGSKDTSRKVAADVASKTGVSDGIIKKMLPYIAPMIMAGMAKKTMGGGLGKMVGTALGKSSSGGSFLGKMVGSTAGRVLGGGFLTRMIAKQIMKRMF